MHDGSLRLSVPSFELPLNKNLRIMFVASCALLLAAANGFYAPATHHALARAKPLQGAKEGVAAAGEKQRIARRSVRKEGQPSYVLIFMATRKKRATI